MNTIAKVAVAGAVAAVLGGFFLGRGVAEPSPLPDVGDPVTVGSTATPTPSDGPTTLRPRADRPGGDRAAGDRTGGDRRGDDNSGPGSADDNSGPGSADDNSGPGSADDDNRGRGRGRGRGGDDGVRTVGPTPSVVDPDDADDRDDDSGDDDD